MKPYWGVEFVKSTQFARGLLKCQLKGEKKLYMLNFKEVEQYTKENRIAPLPSKNGQQG